jgi:predicted PurR-regulated permease PerM
MELSVWFVFSIILLFTLYFYKQIAVPIVFSILQCVLLVFTHETPKFLLQRKRRRAAERGFLLI